jgi:ClpP class serine protease
MELSDKIFNGRGSKPIVAVANSLMASAAFWLGSAADELVITPSGEIGSVGVIATHIDSSLADENFGRKVSIIKAGKFKAEANPHEPLSAEGRDHIQSIVDSFYGDFVNHLARNRGTTPARVRADFGQGRVVRAGAAVDANMADRIGTLQDVLVQMEPKGKPVKAARHSIDLLKLKQ